MRRLCRLFKEKRKMSKFSKADLENIARGAALLSSGGGGTYTSGLNLLNDFGNPDYYPVETVACIDVDEIPASGTQRGAVIAYMGAPEAIENLQYPKAAVAAAEQLKSWLSAQGLSLDYIIPVEIGALSSITACTVAAKLDLPVVNGDGAGRAVPELTMLTYASEGISPNPTIMSNASGISFNVSVDAPSDTNTDALMELVARPIISLPQFDQQAGLAIWVMTVEEIKAAVKIRKTLSACLEIGNLIKSYQEQSQKLSPETVRMLVEKELQTSAYILFSGKLTQAQNLTSGGFDHGQVALEANGQTFSILFQNESLIAWRSDSNHPQAMAPDSIAYLVDNEQIVYSNGDLIGADNQLKEELVGCTVTVIGIAANPALRDDQAERRKNRRAKTTAQPGEIMKSFEAVLETLGYYGNYIPLEELHKKE
jgi:uncharacterized protein